jgi:hypothetical protein
MDSNHDKSRHGGICNLQVSKRPRWSQWTRKTITRTQLVHEECGTILLASSILNDTRKVSMLDSNYVLLTDLTATRRFKPCLQWRAKIAEFRARRVGNKFPSAPLYTLASSSVTPHEKGNGNSVSARPTMAKRQNSRRKSVRLRAFQEENAAQASFSLVAQLDRMLATDLFRA